MSFVGLYSTNQMTQDLAKKSFAGMITRLMPNGQAPLFGMTAMLKTEVAMQIEHGYFSKTMIFPEFELAANITASDTIFNVVSTQNLLPNQIHLIASTGENVIINSVISATQISVGRAIGTVAAQAATSGDGAYQVGNGYEQGSQRPTALNITPQRITNFTQIFRNSWGVTETVRATMVIAGETNVAESKQDCAAFHAADIEKALFFGQKFQGTRNGQPFYTMDGLINVIGNISYYPSSYSTPNVFTAGATTNYTQLEGFVDPTLNQTTDPKVANSRLLFVGATAKKVINNIGRLNATYQIVSGETQYGLQFDSFKTARGTFRMIEHPLFNTNPIWSKMAVVVDMSSFNLAYLGDRKTQHKGYNTSGDVAQDNGIDAQGGTLTTELTNLVKNPPANAVIYNLTAAAAG